MPTLRLRPAPFGCAPFLECSPKPLRNVTKTNSFSKVPFRAGALALKLGYFARPAATKRPSLTLFQIQKNKKKKRRRKKN
jgi:hypothetical protein